MTDTIWTVLEGGPLDGLEEEVALENMQEHFAYDRRAFYHAAGIKKVPFRVDLDHDSFDCGSWTYKHRRHAREGATLVSYYAWLPNVENCVD